MFRKAGIILHCDGLRDTGPRGECRAWAPRLAPVAPLVLEGNTGVTFTNNFNPYDSNSFCKEMSVCSLVYEPLIRVRHDQGGNVVSVARHGVRLVQRWQDAHLHDPYGRQVE